MEFNSLNKLKGDNPRIMPVKFGNNPPSGLVKWEMSKANCCLMTADGCWTPNGVGGRKHVKHGIPTRIPTRYT